jgi:hypothetical protein
MVLRLKGLPDELSPRNLIHVVLALMLLPLLAAKVVIARYYKNQVTILKLLGSFIAGISFLVVIMNLGAYLLRTATSATVSGRLSAAAISAFAAVCIALLLRRPRRADASQESAFVFEAGPTQNSMILQLSRVVRQTHDATVPGS